eukprot:m.98740 g.98740  ORF g.98740 m.98740 type:complete len:362 (-) comp13645_c2_seq1:87-1172(-)
MANRTQKYATTVHATDPQHLVEKIIRNRIYECKYYKEKCFALTAESVIDVACDLTHVGGVFGQSIKPTPFLCIILKLLQIQPDKDIIVEYIQNEDFKYLRCLGAMYMRLVGTSIDCYKYLEPLLRDYRKIKRMKSDGGFELIHVDEFVDELLMEERHSDIILPRLTARDVLEINEGLEPYQSFLDDEEDDEEEDEGKSMDEEEDVAEGPAPRPTEKASSREDEEKDRKEEQQESSRSRRDDRDSRDRNRDRNRDRRDRDSRDRDRDRSRRDDHRSRSRRSYSRSPRRDSPERSRRRSESRSSDSSSDEDPAPRKSYKLKLKGKSKKSKKKDKDGEPKEKSMKDEIAEANALRASLGMAPLK